MAPVVVDYIVVEHDNVLLICQRSEEQRVREFVSDAKARRTGRFY